MTISTTCSLELAKKREMIAKLLDEEQAKLKQITEGRKTICANRSD